MWQLGLQLCIAAALFFGGGRGRGKRRSGIGPLYKDRHMPVLIFHSQTLQYAIQNLVTALSKEPVQLADNARPRVPCTYWITWAPEKVQPLPKVPALRSYTHLMQ